MIAATLTYLADLFAMTAGFAGLIALVILAGALMGAL